MTTEITKDEFFPEGTRVERKDSLHEVSNGASHRSLPGAKGATTGRQKTCERGPSRGKALVEVLFDEAGDRLGREPRRRNWWVRPENLIPL